MTQPTTEPTLEECAVWLGKVLDPRLLKHPEYDAILRALRSPVGGPARIGITLWPFVESPGDFAERLEKAFVAFDGYMLGAVRNTLIENPPVVSDEYLQGTALTRAEPLGAQMVEALEWAAHTAQQMANLHSSLKYGVEPEGEKLLSHCELLRTIARGGV